VLTTAVNMPQKQFSDDSRFRLPWSRPSTEFSGYISVIFVWIIKKIISPLNLVVIFFCVGEMDETNFQDQIFFGLGIPNLGLLISGTVKPLKGTSWEYTCFPSVPLVCRETFCAQDTGYSAVFGSGSAHFINFQNVSRQQSPLPPDICGFASDSVEIRYT